MPAWPNIGRMLTQPCTSLAAGVRLRSSRYNALTKRWLGFEDAHVVFDVDPSGGGSTGVFVSKILIDPAALAGPPLTALRGRWSVERGLVLTAIVL